MSIPQANGTVLELSPESSNDQLRIQVSLVGSTLPKVGIFSTIIGFLFSLGLENSTRRVNLVASQQDPASPAWIFIEEVPTPRFTLQVRHVLALLESIARSCASNNAYQELRFEFFSDSGLIAKGCVTRPEAGRVWCRGLYGGPQEQLLLGNITVPAGLA